MKLQEIKTNNNPIYKEFFSKSNLEVEVEMTIWRGAPSDNSFCFINPEVKYKERKDRVLNKLIEIFDICSDSFKKKFEMAISGDGQEVKRISTLHSSSLAALLLLYSISKNNPLKCELEGKKYEFNNCYFEVKTNVKDDHFSNMDVVLVGKNSEDRNVIFFLESKFSEYLNTGMCNSISLDAYKDKYVELGLISNDEAISGLHFVLGKGKDNMDCLQIKSDNPQYCGGIKQMISHYMGVTNFVEKGEKALDPKQRPNLDELVKLRHEGADIILGEVLFDFGEKVRNGKKKFENYSSIYKGLAMILNDHTSKLYVLPKILTYQELLKGFKLDKKVKDFYQL